MCDQTAIVESPAGNVGNLRRLSEVNCPECGIAFGVPGCILVDRSHGFGKLFCPAGHLIGPEKIRQKHTLFTIIGSISPGNGEGDEADICAPPCPAASSRIERERSESSPVFTGETVCPFHREPCPEACGQATADSGSDSPSGQKTANQLRLLECARCGAICALDRGMAKQLAARGNLHCPAGHRIIARNRHRVENNERIGFELIGAESSARRLRSRRDFRKERILWKEPCKGSWTKRRNAGKSWAI